MTKLSLPKSWRHLGPVMKRPGQELTFDVCGDPCIVWDEEESLWRMFLFYSPPGHGQAVCRDAKDPGPGKWEFQGPLNFENPEDLLGGATHKPFVVMKPNGANEAALVDGRYCLLTVSYLGKQKILQRAWAKKLAGPWVLESGPLLPLGGRDEFDAKHLDAVSGYYFEEQRELAYFYMGYPELPQARPGTSPYGSAQALAIQQPGRVTARKLGPVLPPDSRPGHWASGWVGGLQIFPGIEHRWIGLANASPTAPSPEDGAVSREEPPPSLGGFAFTDSEFPDSGWLWMPEPIEHVDRLPPEALAWGEGTNLWRHHLLCLPSGRRLLFYNSGFYGKEQLFVKEAVD